MKLDSVRALKAELSAEVIAAAGDTPEAYSFYAATPAPMPQGVALGVAQSVTATANDEYVLAIRTSDPAAADAIKARAAGEANVRLLTVTKRTTPGYFQGTRRPLEPGLQVGMASKNFVGTLGCFVRDADGTLYALSNSHVLADEGRASPGHVFGQPFGTSPLGVLARFIPFSTVAPNLVDCALGRLDKTQALVGFDAALGTIPLYGTKRVTADLLGADVWKVGRTTGARKGKVTTVEIDGKTEDVRIAATRLVRPFNLLGWPALVLPCGLTRDGLPLGMQLAGPPGSEAVLLRAGAALEDALG